MIIIWTKKGIIIASLAFSLAAVGIVTQSVLFIITSILFSSILFISYASLTENLIIKRIVYHPKIFEEDVADIGLEIGNKGFFTSLVEVYDKLPKSFLLVEGKNNIVMRLKRGETAKVIYSISSPLRGFYNLGPIFVRSHDMFGIFHREREINMLSSMTIYPRIVEMKHLKVSTKYKKINPGSVVMRTLGKGMDFHSIRDYVTSDPFNRINWKASARKRKLMVNQYELEDVYDLMIFIDARHITRIGTPVDNPLEHAVKAAASLANIAVRKMNRVGLVTYGSDIKVIPPGNSATHMETILASLTSTYSKGKRTFKDALDISMPYLTPKSPIIIITPIQNDNTINDALEIMITKGYQVCLISPSLIDFERHIMGRYSPKYLLVKMERHNQLATIKGLGADVIDWTPERPLQNIIQEVGF